MSVDNMLETVLEQIRSGKVAKRPRAYFVLQSALIGFLAFVTLALSIFVLSLIAYSIHESGEQFLIGFGNRGIATLLSLFPWSTFVLVVALILLLEWLVRNFRPGYRIPMLRIFLGLSAVAVLGGLLLSVTPLHPFLLDRAEHDALPVLGPAYERIHESHRSHGVFRGVVSGVATSTFTMSHDDEDNDKDDGTFIVEPPTGFVLETLRPGDRVFVAGEPPAGGVIKAYGIQKF